MSKEVVFLYNVRIFNTIFGLRCNILRITEVIRGDEIKSAAQQTANIVLSINIINFQKKAKKIYKSRIIYERVFEKKEKRRKMYEKNIRFDKKTWCEFKI